MKYEEMLEKLKLEFETKDRRIDQLQEQIRLQKIGASKEKALRMSAETELKQLKNQLDVVGKVFNKEVKT